MDNTVGLLSALGADCWTGREFVQPRLNPRWARVFLDSLSKNKAPRTQLMIPDFQRRTTWTPRHSLSS